MINEHYLVPMPELVEFLSCTGMANKRIGLGDVRRRNVQQRAVGCADHRMCRE
jgi:hypothetical protein